MYLRVNISLLSGFLVVVFVFLSGCDTGGHRSQPKPSESRTQDKSKASESLTKEQIQERLLSYNDSLFARLARDGRDADLSSIRSKIRKYSRLYKKRTTLVERTRAMVVGKSTKDLKRLTQPLSHADSSSILNMIQGEKK